ncbi:MAG: hypothetical protein AB1578_23390 [Thermodesulfobacteriota bacterium]
MRGVLWILLAWGAVLAAAPAAARELDLRLVYGTGVAGEIDPCG